MAINLTYSSPVKQLVHEFLLIVMPAILDDGERVGISHIILKTKYNFGTMFLAEDVNVIFSDNQ
jgi:hypothetical protein